MLACRTRVVDQQAAPSCSPKMSGLAVLLAGEGDWSGAATARQRAGTPEGHTHGISAEPQSAGCCLPVHKRPWAPQLRQHGDNMAMQIPVSRRHCSKSTQQGGAVVLALLYGQAAKHLP